MDNIEKMAEGTVAPKKHKHVKPAVYAHIYLQLKEIAEKRGYNLLIHGSMSRDLDLVAVPWFPNFTFKPHRESFIEECRKSVGGIFNEGHGKELSPGRFSYVINLNRGGYVGNTTEFIKDPEWYIDISVMESVQEMRDELAALRSQPGAGWVKVESEKDLPEEDNALYELEYYGGAIGYFRVTREHAKTRFIGNCRHLKYLSESPGELPGV